jgi:hypothetical protein
MSDDLMPVVAALRQAKRVTVLTGVGTFVVTDES